MSFHPYRQRDSFKDFFLLPNDIFNMDLSMGELAVYAYLLRCEDRKRLISTERTKIMTKDFRKLNGTLLYTINPIEEALQYFYQRQLQKIK